MNPLAFAAELDRQASAARAKARVAEERGARDVSVLIAKEARGHGWSHYPGSWQAEGNVASTDAPQAHRLDAGFNRADSLGRSYHQPAFPHVGAPVQIYEQPFEELVVSLVADAT